jgi:hypothetical protein
MMRCETEGPMPKKDSRERFTRVASVKLKPLMNTWAYHDAERYPTVVLVLSFFNRESCLPRCDDLEP